MANSNLTDNESSLYDELSLDELFSQLDDVHQVEKKATKVTQDDEFEQIRKSVAKLPKIEQSFNELSGLEQDKKKSHSKKINDPILVTKKDSKKDKSTAGDKWFNMPKGELTEANKRDLKIIQQRAALDPKRHYKKGKWTIPEYFQFGTIIEGPTEFYSSRIKNKDRSSTIMESVINDSDTKKYFKRKYAEIQEKKSSGRRGHYKKVQEKRRGF